MLFLIDGTNVGVRYAFAMLGERQAEPDGPEIQKVCQSVERCISDCAGFVEADGVVVALDTPGGSWRTEVFPDYKANRNGAKTGDWSARLGAYMAAADWRCVSAPGFEADDILATLAHRATSAGHAVSVLSGDSDLLALADTCTVLQFGAKGQPRFVHRPPSWVTERYGVAAHQVSYLKALVGEPGDNLPGVPGVGPKKAAQLISEYPTAQGLMASMALRKEAKEAFIRAWELATLRVDAPLPSLSPVDCRLPARSAA